ncbi:SPL family radical SAM protein [Hymenobacter sp. CRA2]|uniref:SPL family radical SAM protein n=1 Tax=Hymenobacter sp. CRA2 TaxID=1955620 RepID=UPI00098F9012|nr:radical SAM protein [Hymenobacter sp. CRA2]OON65260.1 radical SAM protein [Hymenobacter sp. CRA2]
MQHDLFAAPTPPRRTKLGHSSIHYKEASSILSPATGFMDSYDFTLNPYSGCSFGCSYCYAAFFALREQWGYWVNVKENALALLKKRRKKPLLDKAVYMSSVTDPYQPIDKELELTRNLLRELADYHQVRLVVQTRSPLVTRDIDLFGRFPAVQVNMTITTDSERVRKVFEPLCPGNKVRLQAIQRVHEAGIPACITMTPLLPVEDAHTFAQALLATGISRFIVQPFHAERGKFTAGTREEAVRITQELGWTTARYDEVVAIIKSYIPTIGEGKSGFAAI